MRPLLRISWMCGSLGERHRSSRPSRRHEAYHRASWIRSRVPPEVNPLFPFFFFSAGLLLHKKVSDEVQYLPSDLECCFTRKQHRHQAFSLRTLLITALTREILEWRQQPYSTQTQFDSFSLGNVSNGGVFRLLWKFTKTRGFNQIKKFLRNIA